MKQSFPLRQDLGNFWRIHFIKQTKRLFTQKNKKRDIRRKSQHLTSKSCQLADCRMMRHLQLESIPSCSTKGEGLFVSVCMWVCESIHHSKKQRTKIKNIDNDSLNSFSYKKRKNVKLNMGVLWHPSGVTH